MDKPRVSSGAFVVMAVLLPFAEGGDRVDVVGMSLSVSRLYAAWNSDQRRWVWRRR